MNESPTARAMMIPIAFVEFIPFLPSNQKMNAVKIAGSKRGKKGMNSTKAIGIIIALAVGLSFIGKFLLGMGA